MPKSMDSIPSSDGRSLNSPPGSGSPSLGINSTDLSPIPFLSIQGSVAQTVKELYKLMSMLMLFRDAYSNLDMTEIFDQLNLAINLLPPVPSDGFANTPPMLRGASLSP